MKARITMTRDELRTVEEALYATLNTNMSDEEFNRVYDIYRVFEEARQRVEGEKIEFPSNSIELI